MRNLYLAVFICLSVFALSAQKTLPEIEAEYDGSEYNFEEYSNELQGDSWYDGGQKVAVKAGSSLADRIKNKYAASNAHDFRLDTAWVEGRKDYGIGEGITFTFEAKSIGHDNYTVRGFRIANGYVKSRELWADNSRIKTLKLYADNKPFAVVKLSDVYGFQAVNFPDVKLSRKKSTAIKLEIVEVYPGRKFQDTSIAEINFFGSGIY